MAVEKIKDAYEVERRLRYDGTHEYTFDPVRIQTDEDGVLAISFNIGAGRHTATIAIEDAPEAIAAMQTLIGGAK